MAEKNNKKDKNYIYFKNDHLKLNKKRLFFWVAVCFLILFYFCCKLFFYEWFFYNDSVDTWVFFIFVILMFLISVYINKKCDFEYRLFEEFYYKDDNESLIQIVIVNAEKSGYQLDSKISDKYFDKYVYYQETSNFKVRRKRLVILCADRYEDIKNDIDKEIDLCKNVNQGLNERELLQLIVFVNYEDTSLNDYYDTQYLYKIKVYRQGYQNYGMVIPVIVNKLEKKVIVSGFKFKSFYELVRYNEHRNYMVRLFKNVRWVDKKNDKNK